MFPLVPCGGAGAAIAKCFGGFIHRAQLSCLGSKIVEKYENIPTDILLLYVQICGSVFNFMLHQIY